MVSGTPRSAFQQVRSLLEKAGIEDAAFDAGCLMELAVGREWRWMDMPLSEEQCGRLTVITQRRMERYPLQYLAGNWSFLDFTLEVGPGVLIPRADTEVLCEVSARLMWGIEAPVVLDLCAGSGCVGLGIKRLIANAAVTCVEKSPEAFGYLKKNAQNALPGFSQDIPAVAAVQDDVFLYQNQIQPASIDLIVSNPPYITKEEMATLAPELCFEPNMALEAEQEGLAFYHHIAPAYYEALRSGGWLAVEIGFQQAQAVREIFAETGYQNIMIQQDYGGNDRVVYGKKLK